MSCAIFSSSTDAGVFDGMTYAEIAAAAPEEATARASNKLEYCYPRGESYIDVIKRLDPVIHATEQLDQPLLIIAHQGILRLLIAYFHGLSREEAPHLKFPLHKVVRLTPRAYTCDERVFEVNDGTPRSSEAAMDSHAPSC